MPIIPLRTDRFTWSGGKVGDFITGIGSIICPVKVANELSEAFDNVSTDTIEIVGRRAAKSAEFKEIIIDTELDMDDLEGTGINRVKQCTKCNQYDIEIAHREQARNEVYNNLLDGKRIVVSPTEYEVIALPASILDGKDIFRLMNIKFCTQRFVDFCLERDYTNVGFVRMGSIV